jgi:periplasmic protein TonB
MFLRVLLVVGILSSCLTGQIPPVGAAPKASKFLADQTFQDLITRRTQPVYPDDAKELHIQGDVVVVVQIGRTGSLEGMEVTKGPVALREAALDSVRHWRFLPYTAQGYPEPVRGQVIVSFRL